MGFLDKFKKSITPKEDGNTPNTVGATSTMDMTDSVPIPLSHASSMATAPSESSGISLVKSGALSLTKGEDLTIAKSDTIVAKCIWPSTTDYDVYALVLMKNGDTKVVSTFGSDAQRQPTPSILNGAVKHLGDVKRGNGSMGEESLEIRFTDDMVAVVPVVYSAQSNGGGSFKQNKVTCEISDGKGTTVTIRADQASDNPAIYTVAVGMITLNANGINIKAVEMYSKPGSENRPAFVKGHLVKDAGSKNLYK